jgi:type II secretion system protein G
MDYRFGLKKHSGFTLIELLVVIAIIGLLASVVLVALNATRIKARDTKRKADIAQIQKALELYYDDNQQYPTSGGASQPNAGWSNSADSSWQTLLGLLSNYISGLPKDPLENNNAAEWAQSGYHYSYALLGGIYGCATQQYLLVYQLETASGPDPGFSSCNATFFQYGGNGSNTTVKTTGAKAR